MSLKTFAMLVGFVVVGFVGMEAEAQTSGSTQTGRVTSLTVNQSGGFTVTLDSTTVTGSYCPGTTASAPALTSSATIAAAEHYRAMLATLTAAHLAGRPVTIVKTRSDQPCQISSVTMTK